MKTQGDLVSVRMDGDIAVLTVDSPPVNALGHGVRDALLTTLHQLDDDAGVAGIVIGCAGRTFFAGADISEFGKPPNTPTLRELIDAIADMATPTIAAIHGTALGGGLELALCCHYRIADSQAHLGLPEVKLGLIPGSGGTVRLPKLIGAAKALEMMAEGKSVTAEDALSIGLVDAISAENLLGEAVGFLRTASAKHAQPDLRSERKTLDAAISRVRTKARGNAAPLACIEAVENAVYMTEAEALKRERVIFERLVASEQSAAMRYLFFAERQASKIEGSMRTEPRPVSNVGVIGSGTMGGGIAMAFANAGLPVIIVDIDDSAIERGRKMIERNYAVSVERGSLDAADAHLRLGCLKFSTVLDDLAGCDLIVEAAFEEMSVKTDIFSRLDKIARPGAILATNTSYLDVNAIAQATDRPGDVVGMHFFSPANVMKLLEVVKAERTGADVLATTVGIGKAIRKVPVVVGVCHGFVGNRMLGARSSDMIQLLLEGATPSQVDKIFVDFGWPMGPFQMQDLAGLDISWRNRRSQGATLAIADDLCEAGHFGQKTGRGYYRYEAGSRAPLESPELAAMIESRTKAEGISRRLVTEEEILERTHYPLVNEGARILQEGIVARESDIDVVWANGYGFPRSKGGPMYWARAVGLDHVIKRLSHWHARTGNGVYAPSTCLVELAAVERRENKKELAR